MLTFKNYRTDGYYDELFDENGSPRQGVQLLIDRIKSLPEGEILMRQHKAESLLLKMGITFNVYGQDEGTEKIFPFDIIPRIIQAADWEQIKSGLEQRIFALNEFLQDIYNDRKILRDKVVPEDLILSSESPAPETTPGWEETAGLLRSVSLSESELDAVRFVFESPFCVNNRDVKDYGGHSFAPGTPILAGALDLMTRIHEEFANDKEASTVDSTVEHVLATRKGVCQDFAHLAISCLRSLGLAARYVSGYLETLPLLLEQKTKNV